MFIHQPGRRRLLVHELKVARLRQLGEVLLLQVEPSRGTLEYRYCCDQRIHTAQLKTVESERRSDDNLKIASSRSDDRGVK